VEDPFDDSPLSDAEWARAAEYPRYWIVWYQDHFSWEDPAYQEDAFTSEEAAPACAAQHNGRLGRGSFESYSVTGPHDLAQHFRDRAGEFRLLLYWLDRKK
jgi:hypothetical protein